MNVVDTVWIVGGEGPQVCNCNCNCTDYGGTVLAGKTMGAGEASPSSEGKGDLGRRKPYHGPA